MEDNHMEESEQKLETEVAPALIAVHPSQISVSVSVGSELRVFSLQDGSRVKLIDETGGHKDSIRAIRYSRSGQFFVSGGDDKLVKVWDTKSWRCIYSVVSEKRVTSLAISGDGMFVCFADKFGVVYVVDIGDHNYENPAPVNKKAVPILSHYCSIITRLEYSPDGKYIITADRDFKIRVTVFPKEPLNGAHEIQSFCLGHTEFVSCLAFISCQDYAQGLLVSGSGDSTVRLWDYASGCLLDTCDVGAEAGVLHSIQRQEEVLPAITDLCATADGSLVAVAVQSLPGIMLLRCSFSARTLSVVKVVSVKGETFIPTSIGAAPSSPLLWMVMGASSLQSNDSALLARVRAVSGFTTNTSESTEPEVSVLEDTEIPGGEPLLQALQGKLSIGEEAFSTAAEAVKTAMRNLLIKKQYSAERREFRKRGRNDKKNQTPAQS
ncbi:tRNA (guanine-N(7)-)-methyltransferase non-catalytic subunit wdr4 [Sesamum indicum]|uniref:tRNA (guanine-N(7)-)-methyltransferase non-catalytic subunit n=1 Tax=Sesamum indicum TaxID=4182 RepID=A0A6I9TBP5_SESIN|nr:tRNA (guanine-N(7)-)-methyltransferase non-catalytic subunit wdr4 [Sesamum indicum]XP_020549844.1 tRNA (guanine-N(7)-)-methyltransferase non-catalytic subunit wdr4 [Sesamum indicum]